MKMTSLAFIICMFFAPLMAPPSPCATVIAPEEIDPYSGLIYATGAVECGFDTLAYNPIEEATGYFQIRPIRLKDYNKRTGSHYELDDMFNYPIAEKIFLYYADCIGPYDLEKISKAWNGSGPKTITYWKLIQKHL